MKVERDVLDERFSSMVVTVLNLNVRVVLEKLFSRSFVNVLTCAINMEYVECGKKYVYMVD